MVRDFHRFELGVESVEGRAGECLCKVDNELKHSGGLLVSREAGLCAVDAVDKMQCVSL